MGDQHQDWVNMVIKSKRKHRKSPCNQATVAAARQAAIDDPDVDSKVLEGGWSEENEEAQVSMLVSKSAPGTQHRAHRACRAHSRQHRAHRTQHRESSTTARCEAGENQVDSDLDLGPRTVRRGVSGTRFRVGFSAARIVATACCSSNSHSGLCETGAETVNSEFVLYKSSRML